MRPGWTTPYLDGTGWKGIDEVMSLEGGWHLDIGSLGISVREGTVRQRDTQAFIPSMRPPSATHYGPAIDDEAFARLMERSMTGDEISYKALYLMVYNDPRYAEYREVVEALKDNYSH